MKNSRHFVEIMKEVKVKSDELQVSFNTASFMNVPIHKALDVIQRRPQEDDTLIERTTSLPSSIAELLELCLRSAYFCFNGKFYEQREGAIMGSPVSAVVANFYMEHFE